MKKLIFPLIILCFLSIDIFSQTEAGKFYTRLSSNLSGDYNKFRERDLYSGKYRYLNYLQYYNNSSDVDDKNFYIKRQGFNLRSDIGMFVIDNLVIGLDANFSYYRFKHKVMDINDFKEYVYEENYSANLGPFAKYYLMDGKFKPFVTAGFTFGWSETKIREYNPTIYNNNRTLAKMRSAGTNHPFDWNIGGGAAYFLNKHIAIEAEILFSQRREKEDRVTYINNNIGLNIGFAVTF
ncbi:MAG: outer membrane protein [Hyphomicrobiales bacterium]